MEYFAKPKLSSFHVMQKIYYENEFSFMSNKTWDCNRAFVSNLHDFGTSLYFVCTNNQWINMAMMAG